MRFKGNTDYDRIKMLDKVLDTEDFKNLKKARYIRNKIVHEVGFEVEPKEIQNHFWNIRKVILKLLG
jgi:uncharacterized protein YutE (UPF0331/DUF86 family)